MENTSIGAIILLTQFLTVLIDGLVPLRDSCVEGKPLPGDSQPDLNITVVPSVAVKEFFPVDIICDANIPSLPSKADRNSPLPPVKIKIYVGIYKVKECKSKPVYRCVYNLTGFIQGLPRKIACIALNAKEECRMKSVMINLLPSEGTTTKQPTINVTRTTPKTSITKSIPQKNETTAVPTVQVKKGTTTSTGNVITMFPKLTNSSVSTTASIPGENLTTPGPRTVKIIIKNATTTPPIKNITTPHQKLETPSVSSTANIPQENVTTPGPRTVEINNATMTTPSTENITTPVPQPAKTSISTTGNIPQKNLTTPGPRTVQINNGTTKPSTGNTKTRLPNVTTPTVLTTANVVEENVTTVVPRTVKINNVSTKANTMKNASSVSPTAPVINATPTPPIANKTTTPFPKVATPAANTSHENMTTPRPRTIEISKGTTIAKTETNARNTSSTVPVIKGTTKPSTENTKTRLPIVTTPTVSTTANVVEENVTTVVPRTVQINNVSTRANTMKNASSVSPTAPVINATTTPPIANKTTTPFPKIATPAVVLTTANTSQEKVTTPRPRTIKISKVSTIASKENNATTTSSTVPVIKISTKARVPEENLTTPTPRTFKIGNGTTTAKTQTNARNTSPTVPVIKATTLPSKENITTPRASVSTTGVISEQVNCVEREPLPGESQPDLNMTVLPSLSVREFSRVDIICDANIPRFPLNESDPNPPLPPVIIKIRVGIYEVKECKFNPVYRCVYNVTSFIPGLPRKITCTALNAREECRIKTDIIKLIAWPEKTTTSQPTLRRAPTGEKTTTSQPTLRRAPTGEKTTTSQPTLRRAPTGEKDDDNGTDRDDKNGVESAGTVHK